MTCKKIISVLAAVLASANLCACAAKSSQEASAVIPAASAAATASPETAAAGTKTEITAEEAKKIALAHAGLSESEVTFVRTEYEMEYGKTKYEVEFYKGNTEYDYDIDAATGKILSFDQDAEYIMPSTKPNTVASGRITEDQAYEIALAYAKVSKDTATLKKKKLDYEDGREVFEIEFYAGGKEYEFEIDASDGTVLKFEIDD